MEKPKKYLELYYAWHKRGFATFLCNYFGRTDDFFELMRPTKSDRRQHIEEGFSGFSWGSPIGESPDEFTELRQNIILLMAAMNGELDDLK